VNRVKHKEAATFDGQLDDNDLSITTKDESKQTKNSTNNDTPIGKGKKYLGATNKFKI
jgi:hypothetical protein